MELLIVIGIIAILAALAAPGLSGYVQRLRFQEGVRTFSESLLRARDTASSGSLLVRVEATGDHVAWYDAQNSEELGRAELPNRTAFVSDTSVTISGRGLPPGQVRFDLTDGTLSDSVYLLPTGAILR